MTPEEFQKRKAAAVKMWPGEVYAPDQAEGTHWLYNIPSDVLVELTWSDEHRRFLETFHENPEAAGK